jgi:predicted CXXCH cytochrome family protein
MKRLLLALLLVAPAAAAAPGGVKGSKHDLSVNGPGPIKAVSETRVCIFCHVGHSAAPSGPLSNRPDLTASHRRYESSTMRDVPGSPSGASRLCLSCHDGTIAVGETRRGRIAMRGTEGDGRIPASRRSNIGTDLRRTHPVSFAPRPGTRRPVGRGPKLDARGELQCTSCHDAHSEFGGTSEGGFLRAGTRNSELCVACHQPVVGSAHAGSGARYEPRPGDPAIYASVGEAGCAACHASHGADARGRLLAKAGGETADALCLRCHGGMGARTDIRADAARPYTHSVNPDVHDASESPDNASHRVPETSAGAPRHASCCDCHDPHSASDTPAAAPAAGGALAGAWGVDQSGRRAAPARFEYEVCFKCHGESANQRGRARLDAPRRTYGDANLLRAFGSTAASYHPVVAPGRNADVPSLRAPYSPASLVYCTDCHASSSGPGAGGTGPRGPHGSIYPALLERNYTIGDLVPESPSAYALCYKCHDRDVLLSSRSTFPSHAKHVVASRAPCSVCHVSHGVAGPGASATANAHLVDFDLTVVQPAGGAPRYDARGSRGGSCTLVCHGLRHEGAAY